MADKLRLGIAGLGTVGVGVVRILQNQAHMLSRRTGRTMIISAVTARAKDKDRGVDLSGYAWAEDPVALAKRDDVDVFVELIGGYEGIAKEATETALKLGKDVVTANKALLAHHGQALAELAEENGCVLRYEAAVAGGIPVIKTLLEGLAGNKINRVLGVMNGTCNYILTRMEDAGLTYEQAFAEADSLGYLEADPNLDVGGIDAGHKLAILSSVAFGTKINFDGVGLEGIGNITIKDIENAAQMGFRIKLLGVAHMTGRGLDQRMTPCLVPADSPLGKLTGGTNMVVIEGDSVGPIVLRGAGAGEGPTASAVLGDICDIARGTRFSVFGQPAHTLTNPPRAQVSSPSAYYIRMELLDKPGAMAKIATVLGNNGVSIHRMMQSDHHDSFAPVTFVTHKTNQASVNQSLSDFMDVDVVAGTPVAFRIEDV